MYPNAGWVLRDLGFLSGCCLIISARSFNIREMRTRRPDGKPQSIDVDLQSLTCRRLRNYFRPPQLKPLAGRASGRAMWIALERAFTCMAGSFFARIMIRSRFVYGPLPSGLGRSCKQEAAAELMFAKPQSSCLAAARSTQKVTTRQFKDFQAEEHHSKDRVWGLRCQV